MTVKGKDQEVRVIRCPNKYLKDVEKQIKSKAKLDIGTKET